MEIWKDIDGYNGYQISNLGRVRTHNKITYTEKHGKRIWKDRILKPKISKKDKCSRVELWKDGTHKTILVHRLVAYAFLGKPKNKKMTVNHKDGNRLNNCVDNLEWLTITDNIRHGFENDLYHTQKHCTLIDKSKNTYTFKSMSKASKFLNRCNGYISNCIKRGQAIKSLDGSLYDVVF